MIDLDEKWMYGYANAKKYYDTYHDLDINTRYVCRNGFALGTWIYKQRQKYNSNKLSQKQIKLLNDIDMLWKVRRTKDAWDEYYLLAKNYYNYYGHLKIEYIFTTSDGINYDEDGQQLGRWIHEQRSIYNGTRQNKMSQEKIDLLNDIGMIWNAFDYSWNSFFNLAKNYFNHYGHLKVTEDFATNDGINYDEDGQQLGKWLRTQRSLMTRSLLSDDRIDKLDSISMIWDMNKYNWDKAYEIAKNYYNYYGNLYVNGKFKTKDGITYDSDGLNLGRWLNTQRNTLDLKNPKNNYQIKLLDNLEMLWDYHKERKKIYYIKKQDNTSMKKVLINFLMMLNEENNKKFEKFDDVKEIEMKFSKKLNRR